ncbi:poly [ADP-ribose] polymerase tankyrase-1-like [Schistocerca nitens]|uniref:poly [ADP-ribose] polymerase tankyrase-1-like n=1 Tax=Schistocerca nitens TaxID=7011 RepID=UPI00211801BA|nr:poly [ADP-ribose] polymerase tankyrase-1-like [Schistocerca nitens]
MLSFILRGPLLSLAVCVLLSVCGQYLSCTVCGNLPTGLDVKTVLEAVFLLRSTPSAGESRTGPSSQPHSGHSDDGRSPATAVSPTSPQTTPQPDDVAISLLRDLSGEEKGRLLIAAAKEGSVSKVRRLLTVGADVEVMDENQQNSLHWAAARGHLEVARRLLEDGADVNARDRWQNTPLHQAAWNGQAPVVRLLAASPANHNAKDKYGNTPLHDAARRGHPDAATALLEAGADREVRNDDGDTPLDLAKRNNHQRLVDILGSNIVQTTVK